MTEPVAKVAIENAVYSFDTLFSYLIPGYLIEKIKPGMRVSVPFGRGNTTRIAMVMKIDRSDGSEKLKYITGLIDEKPVISDEMIEIAFFMKNRYFCTYYDALKLMIPLGITYKMKVILSVNKTIGDAVFDLPDVYRGVIKYMTVLGSRVEKDSLESQFGYEIIDEMLSKDILVKEETFSRRVGDKTMKMVSLTDDYEYVLDTQRMTDKQIDTVETLKNVGEVSVKELCYFTGYTVSVVDSLVKKGIARYFDDEVFRIPKSQAVPKKEFILSNEQQKAFDHLYDRYREHKANCSLLYGITGSGKTSVFFRLMEKVLSDNRGIIVMVPEIALTPQLISLFKSYFNDQVAVFHSALSIGERIDEYKRVKRGMAKIVVGTRSAVFAPVNDLGLIIMDEEQEHTYKSESSPRYHARDVAKFRCKYNDSMLLLSSATPSVESFYNAKCGNYSLVTLKERYGNAILPDVEIVDMNDEISRGNIGIYSDFLLERIESNIESHKQSILLLNRRGYNTFISCRSCKEPVTCPNCSIVMTYHSANRRIMCHYCGYSEPVPHECPKCHSDKLRFSGFGTQKAVDDLSKIFPDARILRMDTDATMSKSSHEKILSAFSDGEYDILIGTQMVAKGLDFPNVTLVGILSADQMLFCDDYRSFENTFSLLTQVIGRSGRGDDKGIAVIQTTMPDSPVILLSCRQDYDSFYEDEIIVRKSLIYPPFVDLILIGFVSESRNESDNASKEFFGVMKGIISADYPDMAIRILGPSPMSVIKINNKYRFKILLKAKNNRQLREMLNRTFEKYNRDYRHKNTNVYVDVGPLSI